MKRVFLQIILCVCLAVFLQRKERNGDFHEINRNFLSWLSANTNVATASPSVTFLKVEKGDTFDWPPTPLDFASMFSKLEQYEPEAIAVEPVLTWKDPHPQELSSLVRTSEQFAPVLLGAHLEANSASEDPIDDTTLAQFSPIENVKGDISKLPQFTGIQSTPATSLRPKHYLGHTHIDLSTAGSADQDLLNVPLLARHGDKVIASFVLKAVLLKEKIPLDEVTVSLGESIKAGDSLNIPIDSSGHLAVSPDWSNKVPALSASVLLIGSDPDPALLRPGESIEAIESLKSNLILIGETGEGVRAYDRPGGGTITRAEILANAIATIQSGRFQIRLSNQYQYLIWGIIIVVGLLAAKVIHRRATAIAFGALGVLAVVIVSLLTFQSTNPWCPPTIPVSLVALSALIVLVLASKKMEQPTEEDG